MKKKSTRQVKYHAKFRFSGIASLTKQKLSGAVCLRSCSYGLLTAQQIETSRRLIRRRLKKTGVLLIRVHPFLTRTVKPLGVRMGHGKSSKVRDQVCFVRPGKVIFQVSGVSVNLARTALASARSKLNFLTRLTLLTDF